MTKKYINLEHTIKNVVIKKSDELSEQIGIGTDKFQGMQGKAFTKPVSIQPPGDKNYIEETYATRIGGQRKIDKEKKSLSLHDKVAEEIESEGSKKRKKIKYVARPDTEEPKKNIELGRQAEYKTKIIDENKLRNMLIDIISEAKLSAYSPQSSNKNKNIGSTRHKEETESGGPSKNKHSSLVINPKLKIDMQEDLKSNIKNIGSRVLKFGRFVPGLQTAIGLGSAGYSASQGDWTGAALGLGSAIPGPIGWGFTGANIAREIVSSDKKPSSSQGTSATPALPPRVPTKNPSTPPPSTPQPDAKPPDSPIADAAKIAKNKTEQKTGISPIVSADKATSMGNNTIPPSTPQTTPPSTPQTTSTSTPPPASSTPQPSPSVRPTSRSSEPKPRRAKPSIERTPDLDAPTGPAGMSLRDAPEMGFTAFEDGGPKKRRKVTESIMIDSFYRFIKK